MIMNKLFPLLFLLFLIPAICLPVYGQIDREIVLPDLRIREAPPRDQQTDDDLSMARQLMARGAFISAASYLEDLYAQDPTRRETVNLLLNCYFELKAYSKAELLLQRMLGQFPFEYQYHSDLLGLYLNTGVDSTVDLQINNILDKFPGNPDIHRDIINRLIDYGFNDKALDMIKSGREKFSDRMLFAMERAALFENRGEYNNAVMEYYSAVSSDTLLKGSADRKLASLIRYPGAVDEVIRALGSILDSLPNDLYALKVLQEAFVRSERLEDAFDISVRLDSLTNSAGRELYRYLRNCHQRQLSDQVIKTAEYLDLRDSVGNEISQYRFFYGEALLAVNRTDEAINVYREIIREYPMTRDKAKATLAIANAYRYNLRDYESARVYYDSASFAYNFSPVRFAAWLETARLFVIGGHLDSAETAFSEILIDGDIDERRELISYNLAMIDFYGKKFDDADLAFRKIIADFPRGYYTNNALINSLIIREAQQSFPGALDFFAGAAFYNARLMPDSVEITYRNILKLGQTSLTGLTMLHLAEHYCGHNDTLAALDIIDKMSVDYSDDYFYPYTLKLKGEIFTRDIARKDEAAAIYRDLLQNYDNYPFTGEIREALQNIENSRPAS